MLKSTATTNDLARARVLQSEGKVASAQALCRAVLVRQPDQFDALSLLGQLLVQGEHFGEAVLLLRRAISLKPTDTEASHSLARALVGLGRDDAAIEVLTTALRGSPAHVPAIKLLASALQRCARHDEARALLGDALFRMGATAAATDLLEHWARLLPDDPAPAHRLAAMRKDMPPERAANEYVTYLFDRYAETFDESLQNLGYQGPALVTTLLQAAGFTPDKQLDILDAGCGTGLCASVMQPFAAHLTGVDLSPAMVEKARQRGGYDALVVAELTDYLGRYTAQFDLIVAMDTLNYFGELSTVFRNAATALRPTGCFAFTLEKADATQPGYKLNTNARYSHTSAYVEQQLANTGFTIQAMDAAVLRHNDDEPVHGLAVLARRGTVA